MGLRSLSKKLLKLGEGRSLGTRDRTTGEIVASACVTNGELKIVGDGVGYSVRVVSGPDLITVPMDAAALGLAALSMSTGLRITLEAPVSRSMANQVSRIAQIYRLWSINSLAPLRLELPTTIQDPEHVGNGGIICLSGGIDSTYAAIEALQEGQVEQGLLIAGLDYKEANEAGFCELVERVTAIAGRLGIGLTVAETSIRSPGLHWEMLHAFAFSSVLQSFSGRYSFGAYALDYAGYQELLQHPWGNNSVLPNFFSTTGFPIRSYGGKMQRVDKLRAIADHDADLLAHLSVCWANTTTGGNCGRCRKCTTTRLAFHALGLPEDRTFQSQPPLLEAFDKFKVAKDIVALRGQLVRTCELVDALPEGALRQRARDFEEAVRSAYLRRVPKV